MKNHTDLRVREFDDLQWVVERQMKGGKWKIEGYCRTRIGIECVLHSLKGENNKPLLTIQEIEEAVAHLPQYREASLNREISHEEADDE